MGWYYTLQLECKILPEFIDFIKKRYLYKEYGYDEKDENELLSLPKSYRDVLYIWRSLHLHGHMSEYKLKGDIFRCDIEKKVTSHAGNLKDDYETFLHDIIVPITSQIIECRISSDDYDCRTDYYTDTQLRNIPFRLLDKIKTVEHVYSEDGNEIVETRVIYKHSIKKIQFIDLDREYGMR